MDYTNLYNFQTSSGVIVPNDAEVLSGIQKKFQEIFGAEIDLSAETPVGRLIEAFAVTIKTTLGVTAQTANQFNINEATGIYLDAIAQVYDLQRVAGTRTNITIRCYFSDNDGMEVVVKAGSRIMSSALGKTFVVDSPISSSTAEEDEMGRKFSVGTATAEEIGPIVVQEGTVNSIQSQTTGWIGVSNIGPNYIGTDQETDEEFRERIKLSRPVGVGFDTHLGASLNRIEGVKSACILENATGTAQVKKGVTIPPHSIYVGVDCIETDSLLMEIAMGLARAKPVGVGMVNSGVPSATLFERKITYGFQNSLSQTVYFYKAKKVPVKVFITFSYGKYVGDSIEYDMKNVVSEFVGSIGVGGIIYGTMIANELISRLQIGIGTVLLQKPDSMSPASNSVEILGYETAYCSNDNIFLEAI